MKILVAGLPGSGKTTQAKKIAEDLKLPILLMGGLLREIASTGFELGEKVKRIMHTGALVDDEIVAQVMRESIEEKNATDSFVMEGYPRSLKQIEIFDPKFDKIFNLKLSEDELWRRVQGRGRSDDTKEAVEKRLEVQKRGLEEVLNYYSKKGEIIEIDASKDIDEVFNEIKTHLI